MPFSNRTDISIYYEIHGQKRPPLLLIHGLGANKLKWPPDFIQQLSNSHQVIIFDNRGTGQSDKPKTTYTLEQFVNDAIGILDETGFEKAYVMGVSMGGAIAQHLALKHPERVKGMILLGAGFGGMGHPQATKPTAETLAILTKPLTGDEAQDSRNLWPILYSPHFLASNETAIEKGLVDYLSHNYPATPRYARELQLQMLGEHDTYQKLSDIRCPTLVLTGEDDVVVPAENARLMARRLANAQLLEYSNTGHLAYAEKPSQVAQDISQFIIEN